MSKDDFLRRFWWQVAGGVTIIILVGVFTNVYTIKAAAARSIKNEHKIETLTQTKVDKESDNAVHDILFEGIKENKEYNIRIGEKVDNNYRDVINGQSEIKGLILNLHAK